jgi:hypothetical protein
MNIHGVFVGIDSYHDTKIPNLKCAARDAQVMSYMFQNVGTQAQILLNSRATTVAIRRALSAWGGR